MMGLTSISVPAILLLAGVAVSAQDTDKTIVGCVEVGCPPSSQDTANDNCTVAGRSFPYVGATRIPFTASDALAKQLSWTQGFNITTTTNTSGGDGETRAFGSSFYLGSPPDLDLGGTGACAIFFHGVAASLSFDRDSPSEEPAQGTCSNALGSACVEALTERARNLDVSGAANSRDACDRLREELETNMDDPCSQFSKGSWSNLTAVGKCDRPMSSPPSDPKLLCLFFFFWPV